MANCLMIGCDLHDQTMLLKIAVDRPPPQMRSWGTDATARQKMIADLQTRAAADQTQRIVFAYEACGFGFRLHDELVAAGIECYVLAPSKMPRSASQRQRKTDERDAQMILNIVRSFVLAGVELPAVWIPDLATRDDRQLIRRRLTVAQEAAKTQTRIRRQLKGLDVTAPGTLKNTHWTKAYEAWLEELETPQLPARNGHGAAAARARLRRHLTWLRAEVKLLDQQVEALAQTPRYPALVTALCQHTGIGVLTALVYLTEMGDLTRFENRQQVGSYLGLTPASHATGQDGDRKSHIPRQGPTRVRQVLCPAVWVRLGHVAKEQLAYEALVARNPKHKKIAVVARMRVLGITLWHTGVEVLHAQRAKGKSAHAAPPEPAPAQQTPAVRAA